MGFSSPATIRRARSTLRLAQTVKLSVSINRDGRSEMTSLCSRTAKSLPSDRSYPSYGFAVHRYNANGTLDASFGAGGVVITRLATLLCNERRNTGGR